jgi:hypothetical protein
MEDGDAYREGTQDTLEDFTALDFQIRRALESILLSAHAIKADLPAAEDIAGRVHTLRHFLKTVGHDV